MARIYPFRALRYNPSIVKLQDVVTQPYDKITPAMQQAYYGRSPYNLVRIILGLPELFDTDEHADVYTRAATYLQAWREEGVLVREHEACIFAYSQRFAVPGQGARAERRGFIALGELYDYQQQVVFRHEETLSKPKLDRQRLLQATRTHCEQIFMLYSDPAQTVEKILFPAAEQSWDSEVVDEYGVSHRISRLSDPGTINILLAEMEDRKLIIADGHHRYETALEYARAHTPASISGSERNSYVLPHPAFPEAAAMMTFVNMDSEGLVILPTHRVVHSLPGFLAADFLRKAAELFEIKPLAQANEEQIRNELVTSGVDGTSFVAVTADGQYLLRAKSDAIGEALVSLPERQRRLDVVQLHTLLLDRLLGISAEAIREQKNVRYLREATDASAQVMRGEANLAFLMNPVTLRQLREIAFAGETMPPKSTDFFPKLLSGLAIHALD